MSTLLNLPKNAHNDGFEAEWAFHCLLAALRSGRSNARACDLHEALSILAPVDSGRLFRVRPCDRTLWWTGRKDHPYFKPGLPYEALDFNGATYRILGYGDEARRIGCAHFSLNER